MIKKLVEAKNKCENEAADKEALASVLNHQESILTSLPVVVERLKTIKRQHAEQQKVLTDLKKIYLEGKQMHAQYQQVGICC